MPLFMCVLKDKEGSYRMWWESVQFFCLMVVSDLPFYPRAVFFSGCFSRSTFPAIILQIRGLKSHAYNFLEPLTSNFFVPASYPKSVTKELFGGQSDAHVSPRQKEGGEMGSFSFSAVLMPGKVTCLPSKSPPSFLVSAWACLPCHVLTNFLQRHILEKYLNFPKGCPTFAAFPVPPGSFASLCQRRMELRTGGPRPPAAPVQPPLFTRGFQKGSHVMLFAQAGLQRRCADSSQSGDLRFLSHHFWGAGVAAGFLEQGPRFIIQGQCPDWLFVQPLCSVPAPATPVPHRQLLRFPDASHLSPSGPNAEQTVSPTCQSEKAAFTPT